MIESVQFLSVFSALAIAVGMLIASTVINGDDFPE